MGEHQICPITLIGGPSNGMYVGITITSDLPGRVVFGDDQHYYRFMNTSTFVHSSVATHFGIGEGDHGTRHTH